MLEVLDEFNQEKIAEWSVEILCNKSSLKLFMEK